MNDVVVENAKLTEKGQITLPKDIRTALGVSAGDRVTLVQQDDQVVMMNAAVYAMKVLQLAMRGEAERAGIESEEDVNVLIAKMRAEENA